MSHGSRPTERRLSAEGITRVEGEGSLHALVRDGQVVELGLDIFEPPRFFEALLVGRSALEAPDITSRICGICPVAYETSACNAIEQACGVVIAPPIAALRRLLYCGEWIQSHALHIYFLHAPDFLGCLDAVELAERDRSLVERGLSLKRCGNLVMETVGGRAVHPVNVRVGGFYSAPDPTAIAALTEPLLRAREAALETLEWVAGFEFPDTVSHHVLVALFDPSRYAIETGTLVRASNGLEVDVAAFEQLVVEEHVERSTALHARLFGETPYLTGPLARYALNGAQLHELARDAAGRAGLGPVCENPFQSIVVRAVELVEVCDEALRIVAAYEPPEPACAEVVLRAGAGVGASEAPRGLLFHRYELADGGRIERARIVPPTSQNQLSIEADLQTVIEAGLDLDDEALTARLEQAVRNHDPCISCAAHFLDVEVTRA